MKPSWVVIAGGSSLSVSPPQRNVSVPVGPAGFAVAPVCAAGAQAATSVAAPAARRRSRRVMVESFIANPPLGSGGSIAPENHHFLEDEVIGEDENRTLFRRHADG